MIRHVSFRLCFSSVVEHLVPGDEWRYDEISINSFTLSIFLLTVQKTHYSKSSSMFQRNGNVHRRALQKYVVLRVHFCYITFKNVVGFHSVYHSINSVKVDSI